MRSVRSNQQILARSGLLLLALVWCGCQSPLDKDRAELEQLRKSIGTVETLRQSNSIQPLQSDPDEIAKIKSGPDEDARLNKIIEILESEMIEDVNLAESRQQTLINNLDLQAAFIEPKIAQEMVRVQQAKFESTFNLSLLETRTVAPEFYGGSSTDSEQYDEFVVTPAFEVPLRTGGTVSLDWSMTSNLYKSDLSTTGYASNSPSVKLEQPLLRDAGVSYNEASIVVAEAEAGASLAAAQFQVVNTLLTAETAYWNLHLAWRTLEIQVEIYKRTRSVLNDARELVSHNSGSISSVYNFEVTLANAVSLVIQAERALRLAVRKLKVTMQDPTVTLDSSLLLKTSNKPALVAYTFDKQKLVDLAIANRSDLLEREFEQAKDAVNVLMAENQLLPEFNLIAGYTFNGFDSEAQSFPNATNNLFNRKDGDGWQIGFDASVPLGNEAAIATYQAALFTRLRSIADIRSREIMVTREVLDAIDNLETGWQNILTTRFEVAAAQRNVDAMSTLFQLGERTSSDLAQAIMLLSQAQTASATAEATYQIDLAVLASATGCMLGHAGVEWGEYSDLEGLEDSEVLAPPIPVDVADTERDNLSNIDEEPTPMNMPDEQEPQSP